MSAELPDPFERLGALLVEAQQAVEQAEAKVGQFNELVHSLAEQGRLPRGIFLGKTIASLWGAEAGLGDSGRVVQAVLLVPDRLGVSRFDTEVYYAHTEDSGGLEDEVRATFVPFARCDPGEKAFFYSEMRALSVRFLTWAAQRAPAEAGP
jgi:hypothetical protein